MSDTVSILEPRVLIEAVNQLKPAYSFLRDTFFPGSKTFATTSVDLDVVKGKRRMAPFVNPLMEGKIVDRIGFSTHSYKPPYIKPKRVTTAQALLTRRPGEAVYGSTRTAGDRALELIMEDYSEFLDMIVRREEWMASQALTTGSIHVVGDAIDDTIDFLMDSNHKITLSGAGLWSAPTTSDPIANLTAWSRLVAKDSGIVPNIAVLGSDVAAALLNHPAIKSNSATLSSIKLTLGQIQPSLLGRGVTFLGTLTLPGVQIDLYTYDEYFLADGTGVETPMVPADKLILGSDRTANSKLYGAIQDVEVPNGLAEMAYFPKMWKEQDPSAIMVMLQSAPLAGLLQPDAFLVAKAV